MYYITNKPTAGRCLSYSTKRSNIFYIFVNKKSYKFEITLCLKSYIKCAYPYDIYVNDITIKYTIELPHFVSDTKKCTEITLKNSTKTSFFDKHSHFMKIIISMISIDILMVQMVDILKYTFNLSFCKKSI